MPTPIRVAILIISENDLEAEFNMRMKECGFVVAILIISENDLEAQKLLI